MPMPDHIVDTNVLCAASTSDAISRFNETDHVPLDELEKVLNWLVKFRQDATRRIVLDEGWRLIGEYKGQLGERPENNIGMRVVYEKMASGRLVDVPLDSDGRETLPQEVDQAYDYRGDRKLVALALADQPNSTIVNACDTDWYDWEETLKAHGVIVDQIIGDWCEDNWQRKMQR